MARQPVTQERIIQVLTFLVDLRYQMIDEIRLIGNGYSRGSGGWTSADQKKKADITDDIAVLLEMRDVLKPRLTGPLPPPKWGKRAPQQSSQRCQS